MLTERQESYLNDLRQSEGGIMVASHHPRLVRRTFESLVNAGLAARQMTGTTGWTRYVPTLDAMNRANK